MKLIVKGMPSASTSTKVHNIDTSGFPYTVDQLEPEVGGLSGPTPSTFRKLLKSSTIEITAHPYQSIAILVT